MSIPDGTDLYRETILNDHKERLLDVKEVATLLHVPRSWVYANAEGGNLPSLKIGKYRRFKLSEIRNWMDAQRQVGIHATR